MSVRAVVFDMDGLILDTESLYKVSWQAASADLGYPIDDALYVTFVGRQNVECERTLVSRFGPAFPLDEFRTRWHRHWRATADTAGIPVKPGLVELLAFLDARQLPFAIATSSDADEAAYSLCRAGLDGRFDIVVTGDVVARGKPAPDIYLEAARRLGVQASVCVALEDSEAGALSASRAGMRALLVPDFVAPSADAVRAAFRVLRSLHDARAVIEELLGSS